MKKKKIHIITFLFILSNSFAFSQGRNHNWLIGYLTYFDQYTTSEKARLHFDSNNVVVVPESLIPDNRKMTFNSAQSNISDENGNLLMATNGCWIMDATGDTMLNGSGLNPGPFTNIYCQNAYGIPYAGSSIILPFPGNSNKYIMFHETGNTLLPYNGMASELYYSVININLNGGLGAVTQKNIIAFHDTLCQGLAACKHANGRDWWITIFKDSSDIVFKILLTPQGISSISQQSLNVPHHNYFDYQSAFSPDGTKFAYTYASGSFGSAYRDVRLFNFDRCSGMFSNPLVINLSTPNAGCGLAFSSSSKYLYATSFDTTSVFQFNTDTSNVAASQQLVAINDGNYSPIPPFQTDFWFMYLAANGKIYISSGSSVVDMHYINYPDSGGIACDVQQHALHLPCWYFSGNVNHPNYYLGPVTGSICDSLGLSVQEINHNFHFNIYPNPVTEGYLKIIYLLPQNKSGTFVIFDINGRKVFSYSLPQWSTLQYFQLPNLSNGLYNCVIISENVRTNNKLAVIKE